MQDQPTSPYLPQTPSLSLSGKTALVTGAGRGIGVALASALAAAGAHVYLAARSGDEIGRVADALTAEGHQANPLKLDVTDFEGIDRALGDCPAFDILVNNAGTNRPKPIGSVTVDDFDAVTDLNLKATYFVTKAVVERMVSNRIRGSIIMISSQMGHVGARNRTLYCASKHAVEGLTKSLAIELAPHGIRANTIAPTFIETPMTRPFLNDPEFRQDVLDKIKLARLGQPQDLMGAVLLLASDASSLITGTSIRVDGGWTAG